MLAVQVDGAGAGLAHREPDLVEDSLVDSGAACDGSGDQPGSADVSGKCAEPKLDGGHAHLPLGHCSAGVGVGQLTQWR